MLVATSHEVSYERVKDIDFSSSKKLKDNIDQKINSLEDKTAKPAGKLSHTKLIQSCTPFSRGNWNIVYKIR